MMTKRINLQPGDYVATADIKDDAEYHAIAKAFTEAGAKSNEYPDMVELSKRDAFGWSANTLGLLHACGPSLSLNGRQLTPDQILTTPQWVPEVGERAEVMLSGELWESCEIAFIGNRFAVFVTDEDGEQVLPFTASRFRPIPTEEDRAVEEMAGLLCDGFLSIDTSPRDIAKHLHRAGYRKQPQPAEDMSDPANWRAGDWVECVDEGSTRNHIDYFTNGMEYKLLENDGSSSFRYMANDGKRHFADNICFRFVRRP